MQMKATVTKTYYCAWKCTGCGQLIAETGTQVNSAESSMGFTRDAAAQRARAAAESKAEKSFAKMVRNVNEHKNFNQLGTSGKCPHCGAKQPWVTPTMRKLLVSLVVALVIFAVMFFYRHHIILRTRMVLPSTRFFMDMWRIIREQPYLPAVVVGILSLPITWLLQNWLHNKKALRALEETRDPLCYPLVLVTPLPEGVDATDLRVQAAFTLVAKKNHITLP